MQHPIIQSWKEEQQWLALAGFRLQRVLSAELFKEVTGGISQKEKIPSLFPLCHERWTDLADALAALPVPVEAISVLGKHEGEDAVLHILAVGRGKTEKIARADCARAERELFTLCGAFLDYAEWQRIDNAEDLCQILTHLKSANVQEITRRYEEIHAGEGRIGGVGFRSSSPYSEALASGQMSTEGSARIRHLYPWVPSNSTWRPLLEVFASEPGDIALIAHWRGWQQAPANCRAAAREALAAAERIAALDVHDDIRTVLRQQANALRDAALRRFEIIEGRVLSARIFLTSGPSPAIDAASSPSGAAVAAAVAALDDASVSETQMGVKSTFCNGAKISLVDSNAILSPMDEPQIDWLFGSTEASSFLRTPMPADVEMPGLLLNRSRTAALTGQSGGDAPLGLNVHRALCQPVALEDTMRFRHTYVVGQTGTGKSTMLFHMIHHDISRGRGVAVLDPHGTLIEQILDHYPPERADDLVVVDVTDTEYPIGFNVLRLMETDPQRYREARDRVIDDIYSYLDRTYNMKETGGPIFESHFRGILALLMGREPQKEPLIPNLMIFRSLYSNKALRKHLTNKVRGDDPMLDDFITEIESATGDASLTGVATYVTSKFNRFISDLTLRNMICQNQTLDLEEIVNSGKVLLFHTGRGRFGDQVSGLLASQVVSRLRQIIMGRESATSRPFYLYADEFQTFADERFCELLAEARKFGLALTIAHQYTNQLPLKVLQGVLGNVGTVVAFRGGPPDGEELSPLFSPYFTKHDLTSLPNFRAYVRSQGKLGSTPFSVDIRPPSVVKNADHRKRLTELSRAKYGRSRTVVESEINSTFQSYKIST
jgi:hypothetical protein